MELSRAGRPIDDVIAELETKRADDARWRGGRTFGLVYDGGPSVHAVAERAAALYLHENALNTRAFPSLGAIQNEVVGWTASLLHGPDTAAGFLTSGGTESIQCAVLAARERGRIERGIEAGSIVVAESAHAAFHKSAHLFRMPIRTVPVRADFTADVDAMASAVDDTTVLVVGSAPQYPQGVVDPIPAIAELAASVGANCHVDACMGGFVLPFAEMLGRDVPPWDFRVDGVHSVSADVHKLGYAPKGVSVILHRTKELRRYQTWVFDAWLGGLYGSPNLQGTRSGLPMAAAWAVMQHLGVDGYVELTDRALTTANRMRAAIAATDGIRVLGDGRFHLVALASDPASDDPVDVFALGDALARRGWYHDRQGPPDSLHSTVSNGNAAVIEECVAAVRGNRTDDRSTNYSTIE
jgi:glutamate/tyrosine decarboxylase-like PLP-dependent enzyme